MSPTKEEPDQHSPSNDDSKTTPTPPAAPQTQQQQQQQQPDAGPALGWNHPVIWVIIVWIAMLSYRDYSAAIQKRAAAAAAGGGGGRVENVVGMQEQLPGDSGIKIMPETMTATTRGAAEVKIQPINRRQQEDGSHYRDMPPQVLVQYCK